LSLKYDLLVSKFALKFNLYRYFKGLRIDRLRAAIGVVSQEPLLFEASLRANIAVGRASAREDSVPLADIEAAARAASAHDFISSFPDGYDTIVGGKNSKLSGGGLYTLKNNCTTKSNSADP
jgi:ABC-type bacteriocin/lantibiotic exporter with double-glycine peptidase domain